MDLKNQRKFECPIYKMEILWGLPHISILIVQIIKTKAEQKKLYF